MCYADRLIALQDNHTISSACGAPVWDSKHKTHGNNPCNCTGVPASPAIPAEVLAPSSKWRISAASAHFVGRAPTWIPFFYYQLPAPFKAYTGAKLLGEVSGRVRVLVCFVSISITCAAYLTPSHVLHIYLHPLCCISNSITCASYLSPSLVLHI
jgi:hypothetical protein